MSALSTAQLRRTLVAVGVVVALIAPAIVPGLNSTYRQGLVADAAILGLLVLSLVVLTGFVGQISFCQYSFAAFGAFTVGSLAGGHHWSVWLALPVGVVFAAAVGVLVGIPALRLSGLFLAILTVAVALATDRWLLSAGVWDSFSGGTSGWTVSRPTLFGISLAGEYRFYLVCITLFFLGCLLVWNLRIGKTGRVLRAVRESEVAAATCGLNLTAWKLTAFGLSAGLAGLGGGLAAVRIGSTSAGAFDFLHSVQLAASAAVWGVGSVAAAAFAGLFTQFGPDLLSSLTFHHLANQWFPVVLGAILIVQLVTTPSGIIPETEARVLHRLGHKSAESSAAATAGVG